MKRSDEMQQSLLKEIQAFLMQGEHEIVSVYSDDYNSEPIYCGLAPGWETERDALLQRIEQLIGRK